MAPNTSSLDGRLTTFRTWPHPSTLFCATPHTLAHAGFYVRHIDGSTDNVCCFMCAKNLDGWIREDDAWQEHVNHAGHCPLVRLDLRESREETFRRSGWPHKTLDAGRMAEAGFFAWPKGEHGDDTAICVQCGLSLENWESDDDPWYCVCASFVV